MNKPKIVTDYWIGNITEEQEIDNVDVTNFNNVFNRLDASRYTMVVITNIDDKEFVIGGGKGRYVVYCAYDEQEFMNLVRDEPAEGYITLFIGGQEGDYPSRQVVGKEQARKAGEYFIKTGELDPEQKWEEG